MKFILSILFICCQCASARCQICIKNNEDLAVLAISRYLNKNKTIPYLLESTYVTYRLLAKFDSLGIKKLEESCEEIPNDSGAVESVRIIGIKLYKGELFFVYVIFGTRKLNNKCVHVNLGSYYQKIKIDTMNACVYLDGLPDFYSY